MVLRSLAPIFLVSLALFAAIVELADLFSNIVNYLNQDVPLKEVLYVQLLYLPKCVSYALPIALLFSVSFTMGNLYSHNELISVFGAGVPLIRFVLPILIVGALFSVGSFFFQEDVVIGTLAQKTQLSQSLLNIRQSKSNTNVTVLADNADIIYYAEYYNDATTTLNNVTVVVRNTDGDLVQRIDADWATWSDTVWQFHHVRVFNRNPDTGDVTQELPDQYQDPRFDLSPDTFRRTTTRKIDEMRLPEARQWVASLRQAGLPYREALTSMDERYSFALTPLIVVLISAAIGGRFRKNVMLMSLLVSLVLSVIYYVIQMIAGLLAGVGAIIPSVGAWTGAVVYLLLGMYLFRTART